MITRNEAKIKLEKEREEQDTIYPVYVDGNMHHLPKVIRTYKELITVKKCKKIVETVENHFDIKIKRIEINMCESYRASPFLAKLSNWLNDSMLLLFMNNASKLFFSTTCRLKKLSDDSLLNFSSKKP